MKWFRLLLIISLLAGMLLCPGVIYADGGDDDSGSSEDSTVEGSGLVVGIGIVGDNPEVNIGVDGDDAEINVGVGSKDTKVNLLTGEGSEINMGVGQESIVYVNGHNINTYSTSGDGQEHFDWKSRKLIKDLGVKVDIMANGLAKVILETVWQDSTITSVAVGMSEHSSELKELEDTALSLSGDLSALEESLGSEITMLQAKQLALQSDFYFKLKLLLGVIGALIVSNIVIIARMKRMSQG